MRTARERASLAAAAQRAVWSVDKEQAISFVMSMEQLASETIAPQHASVILIGIFAGMALLLAAIGIYGVISYAARQRTQEIGIRMALGAEPRAVLRLVMGEGLRLTVLGLGIGLTGALVLTRFLSSILYGVRPSDPMTFVMVALILATVALLASFMPARRATRVDPMAALRHE